MNQIPPTTRKTIASATASTVLICVATNVVTTGPTTQMISCAEASREKSGVSWREFTILG